MDFKSAFYQLEICHDNFVIQDSKFSFKWKTKQKIKENNKNIGVDMNKKIAKKDIKKLTETMKTFLKTQVCYFR